MSEVSGKSVLNREKVLNLYQEKGSEIAQFSDVIIYLINHF